MEWDDYFVQMNSFEILNTVINNNFKGWALLNKAMDTNCWNIFWGVETAYFENGNLRLSQNIKAVMKVITDYFLWQK